MPGPGLMPLRDKANLVPGRLSMREYTASLNILRYPYPTNCPANQMLPGGSTIFRVGGEPIYRTPNPA